MELSQFINIARGNAPADLLLKGGQIVNVFSGEVHDADIAIADGRIVGVGTGFTANETIDVTGKVIAPGFIDAHVHIESSMVPPPEFARAVVPRGTTTVITDPHEIGNVLGLDGIRYMFDAAKYNPLSMFVMLPSCVPATDMETSGAVLRSYDVEPFKSNPWVLGLAEMMNYPGTINGDPEVLAKIRLFKDKIIDGHAPGLTGLDLNAYVAAGIRSDHECTTVAEAREKLRLGMTIFIREGTTAHNLDALLPVITPATARRICWCTDDREPADLLDQGGIDYVIRRAIRQGIDPVTAIQIGTINPASYYGLHDRGAITPGRRADLVVLDNLRNVTTKMVLRGGAVVAQDGQLLPFEKPKRPARVRGSMNVNWDKISFRIEAKGRRANIIGVIPDQIVTEHLIEEAHHRERRGCAGPRARSVEDRRDRSACQYGRAHGRVCEGRGAAAGRDRLVHRARSSQPGRYRRRRCVDDDGGARGGQNRRRVKCRQQAGCAGAAATADCGPHVRSADRNGARPDGRSPERRARPRRDLARSVHGDVIPGAGGDSRVEDYGSGTGRRNEVPEGTVVRGMRMSHTE